MPLPAIAMTHVAMNNTLITAIFVGVMHEHSTSTESQLIIRNIQSPCHAAPSDYVWSACSNLKTIQFFSRYNERDFLSCLNVYCDDQ